MHPRESSRQTKSKRRQTSGRWRGKAKKGGPGTEVVWRREGSTLTVTTETSSSPLPPNFPPAFVSVAVCMFVSDCLYVCSGLSLIVCRSVFSCLYMFDYQFLCVSDCMSVCSCLSLIVCLCPPSLSLTACPYVFVCL